MQLFGGKKRGRHADKARSDYEYEDDYEYASGSGTPAPRPSGGGKKPKKKKSKAGKVILIILLCIILLLAGAYIYIEYFMEEPVINSGGLNNDDDTPSATAQVEGRKEGVYTLLVAGVDQVSNNTDTIMIGRLDTVNETLNIISIPRDTLTNLSHEVKKANSAYHYAAYYSEVSSSSYYGCDPIEVMREELVQAFLGFDVDGYILVNMEAAAEVVDTVGGIDFDVPQNFDYEDPMQDLYIHISAGQQTLSGEQFVQLMRFRSTYAGGDIERIEMQHTLLLTAAKQMLSLKNIPNLSEIASIVTENMTTSLTTQNILFYAKEFLKLDSEDINFYTLPGDTGGEIFGASYVFCDIDAWLDMVNEYLNPWEQEVTTQNVDIVTYMNGNFYSTTGELRGGVESFLNYSSESSVSSAEVYPYTGS